MEIDPNRVWPTGLTLAESEDLHRHVIEGRHTELLEVRRRQSDEVRAIAARLDEARRRRNAAERERRQRQAEQIIHDDAAVRSLMDQYPSARIVPGSVKYQ